MLIRDIDRSLLPRTRTSKPGKGGKSGAGNPLREAAEGLGTFLDRLSESVRESRAAREREQEGDSVDSGIKAHIRSPMRTFKWPAPAEEEGAEPAPAVEWELSAEQGEAVNMLREARAIASDASSVAVSYDERINAQERMKNLFLEVSAKRIDILASMLDGVNDLDNSPFSIITPESARTAYSAIDSIITRFLEVENGIDGSGGEGRYEHAAALSASEQLRDFLLNEGPNKAFARFREINRNNVLGLIQQ